MEEGKLDDLVQKSSSVVKMLFAIMNEEEDIDIYGDKSPEEMTDIVKLVDARYPEKEMASYDPMYTLFGQVLLNGYNTFGLDFLRLLSKRNDSVPIFCYKGLMDIYTNSLISCEELSVLVKKFVTDLTEGKVEEATKLATDIMNNVHGDMSDEEFIEKNTESIGEDLLNN